MPSEPDVPEAPTVTARGSHVGAEPSDGTAALLERDLSISTSRLSTGVTQKPQGRYVQGRGPVTGTGGLQVTVLV